MVVNNRAGGNAPLIAQISSEIFLLEYHSERQRWMNVTGVFKLDSLLGKVDKLPV
jgi:hypothetical protein